MVKELLWAETIYKNQGSLKGQAISELLISHIIVSEFLGYQSGNSFLLYAEEKIIESIFHLE